MSQHIKSLIQQLQPYLTSKTPSPSSAAKNKLTNKNKLTAADNYASNLFCLSANKLKNKSIKPIKSDNHYYRSNKIESPVLQTPIINKQEQQSDSGVDTTLSMITTPIINKVCDCTRCKVRANRRIQVEKSLKLAFSNYLKTPSDKSYANIPMLVVKSFQPTTKTLSNQLDQIEIRKGNAVNALFMNDNKWIYVKTASNQIGFIPKKCCEPFVLKKCKQTTSDIKILEEFNTPLVRIKPVSMADHTYMTINENDLETYKNKRIQQQQKFKNESIEYINIDKDLDEEYVNNQTNLTLFSVSNVADKYNRKISPEKLQHIQKFIDSNNKVYIQSSDKIKAKYLNISQNRSSMISMLKKSQSRNRKVSIAFANTEATLTMLEQDSNESIRNYENLADMNCLQCETTVKRKKRTVTSNISPIQEESFVCSDSTRPKCKKELKFVYDNLRNFKSKSLRLKRAKYSNESSSSSSSYESVTMSYLSNSPSSSKQSENNYDSLIQQKTNEYLNVNSINYLNQEINFSDEKHIYNHLSSNNSKILNMLKVVDDYSADFKDDLTVYKGDLVYLIEGSNKMNSPTTSEKSSDWLFVRIYKRSRTENSKKFETHTVQGYIPRSHVVKI